MPIEISGGEVKGLRELNEKLKRLGKDIERQAMRKGVRAAGRVILQQAKTNARRFKRQTGTLEKSIGMTVRKRRDGRISAIVGLDKTGFYGRFLEQGFHAVGRAKRRGASGRRGRGAARDRGAGRRVAGRPFLGPALEQKAEAALAEFERAIREFINSL